MTVLALNGAEVGIAGEFAGDSVSGTGSTVTYNESTVTRAGTFSLKCHSVNNGHAYAKLRGYSPTDLAMETFDAVNLLFRGYVRFDNSTPLNDTFFTIRTEGDEDKCSIDIALVVGTGIALRVTPYSGGTVVSSAIDASADVWHKLAIHVGTLGALSALKVWWDNTLVVDTMADLGNFIQNAEAKEIWLGRPANDTGPQTVYFDDMIIHNDPSDSWHIDDGGVVMAVPTGDGSEYDNKQWTKGSPVGSTDLYTRVDELPPSDADYIGPAKTGDNYSADMTDRVTLGIDATINAVQAMMWARRNVGAVTNCNLGLSDGTNTDVTLSGQLPGAILPFAYIRTTDLGGGGIGFSDFDNFEVMVKAGSGANDNKVAVAALYLMADYQYVEPPPPDPEPEPEPPPPTAAGDPGPQARRFATYRDSNVTRMGVPARRVRSMDADSEGRFSKGFIYRGAPARMGVRSRRVRIPDGSGTDQIGFAYRDAEARTLRFRSQAAGTLPRFISYTIPCELLHDSLGTASLLKRTSLGFGQQVSISRFLRPVVLEMGFSGVDLLGNIIVFYTGLRIFFGEIQPLDGFVVQVRGSGPGIVITHPASSGLDGSIIYGNPCGGSPGTVFNEFSFVSDAIPIHLLSGGHLISMPISLPNFSGVATVEASDGPVDIIRDRTPNLDQLNTEASYANQSCSAGALTVEQDC